MYSKLQYISQGSTAIEQLENIQSVLDAGCEWIQLRFKNANEKEFAIVSKQVKIFCEKYKATFIINDNVELVKSIDADGVHLGLQDMSITQARNTLGTNKIIGGTANTLSDAMIRVNEGTDYIGLGPFRFTTTKEKLSPVIGLEGIKKIMNELVMQEIKIPVYAIGGILADDMKKLINIGIYGVAVSSAITNNSNKKELIRNFNSLLHEKINNSQ